MTRRIDVDQYFQLDAVLDGTQDFRWRPRRDGWHSGVLDGNLIHIRQGDAFVEYRADSDLDALLRSYFRLDADILAAHADLSARDNRIARLVRKYPHLRVLRQPDPLGVHGFLHLLRHHQRQSHQRHGGECRGEPRTPA